MPMTWHSSWTIMNAVRKNIIAICKYAFRAHNRIRALFLNRNVPQVVLDKVCDVSEGQDEENNLNEDEYENNNLNNDEYKDYDAFFPSNANF